MRIFYSFLIIVCSAILFILPVTDGIYSYRTDQRTDDFTVATAVATTNATVQLFKAIYDDDVSTIDLTSDDTDDTPLYNSYNTVNRALVVTGLSANTTRTLSVAYDVDVINDDGVDGLLDVIPWIWILICAAFPISGLVAIWLGKA